MLKELVKLANHLDSIGLTKEADHLDAAIRRVAHADPRPTDPYGDEMSSEEQDVYDAKMEDRVRRVMTYAEEMLLASARASSMKEFYDYGLQPAGMTAHPNARGVLEYQLNQAGPEGFLEQYEDRELLDELEAVGKTSDDDSQLSDGEKVKILIEGLLELREDVPSGSLEMTIIDETLGKVGEKPWGRKNDGM